MEMQTPNDVDQLNQQIRFEEIKLLYGGTPFSYSASVLVSSIIFYILHGNTTSQADLNLWFMIMLGVMFVRSIESYRFSKLSKKEQENIVWRIRFFVGTGVAGLCWGLLPWLGASDSIEYLSLIIMCQIGVIGGSQSTLSFRWEAMVLFLLPSTILLTLKLLTLDNVFSNSMIVVLIVFVLFSLSAGKRLFTTTQQSIRLRLEADSRERAIGLMHQKQALHIKNTPLAIIEFDVDMNISEWNKAAEDIFGYTRNDAIDENIMRLILPRDSSDEAESLWQRLLNYEALTGATIENKTKDGIPIFCQWFVTPLTDKNNEIAGIAAMALDITDKKQSEIATLKSMEEAEKANQAKSNFLSNMSHELRTPLNAILGFTQLLKFEKDLSKKQQSHISEIGNAGNLLLELVNQILDLARIEKGHLQLSMERVELSDIFQECHAMVLPLAEQKNITLNIKTELSSFVIADYTRLKQTMLNLLGNAIKYNVANGKVSINITQKENYTIRISVIDTGKGISKQLLPDIFQAFNRLNAAEDIEGTGIGLSISKQLINMMNGEIGVISTVNEGSEFWVELTGKIESNIDTKNGIRETIETPNVNLLTNNKSNSHKKILVAEDNPTNQTLIINQLETLGYQADLVSNGQEALNKMVDNTYQLLFTDCNMPIIDGYNLAKKIRDRGNSELPIVAITADAFPERKEECLKAGMNDQITKPVNLETLKHTLEKYLN